VPGRRGRCRVVPAAGSWARRRNRYWRGRSKSRSRLESGSVLFSAPAPRAPQPSAHARLFLVLRRFERSRRSRLQPRQWKTCGKNCVQLLNASRERWTALKATRRARVAEQDDLLEWMLSELARIAGRWPRGVRVAGASGDLPESWRHHFGEGRRQQPYPSRLDRCADSDAGTHPKTDHRAAWWTSIRATIVC
jgi:hypothetical protein